MIHNLAAGAGAVERGGFHHHESEVLRIVVWIVRGGVLPIPYSLVLVAGRPHARDTVFAVIAPVHTHCVESSAGEETVLQDLLSARHGGSVVGLRAEQILKNRKSTRLNSSHVSIS